MKQAPERARVSYDFVVPVNQTGQVQAGSGHSSPYSIGNVDMLRGGANETHVAHLAVLESFCLPLAKMLWCLLLLLRFEMEMMIRNAFSQQVRKELREKHSLWNSHLSFCLL